ncbi:hypothetical protein N7453_005170 [Penicillium expansum]|nr:hypothetical protein N7453_005170 [Penicillium expansum]
MGLSTFHSVETRTQYMDIWLLVTCQRTFTSLVFHLMCVALFRTFLLGEISTVSSFIHSQPHFLFFQRGLNLKQNKSKAQKKFKTP